MCCYSTPQVDSGTRVSHVTIWAVGGSGISILCFLGMSDPGWEMLAPCLGATVGNSGSLAVREVLLPPKIHVQQLRFARRRFAP
jgi:hypothetical protein